MNFINSGLVPGSMAIYEKWTLPEDKRAGCNNEKRTGLREQYFNHDFTGRFTSKDSSVEDMCPAELAKVEVLSASRLDTTPNSRHAQEISELVYSICELERSNFAAQSDTQPRTDNNFSCNAKSLRQSGQAYVNKKGKFVPPPKFEFKICKCHMNCSQTFPEFKRRAIFDFFWKLGNWESQSNFILQSVAEVPCKRRYSKENPVKRMVTRKYVLDNKSVCQSTFTSTLGVNPMRVDYCLRRKASEYGCCSPDGRGKKKPSESNLVKEDEDNFQSTSPAKPVNRIVSNMICDLQNHSVSSLENIPKAEHYSTSTNPKILRQSGRPYINRNGKFVPPPSFHFKICKCHMNCSVTMPELKRRSIFEYFWRLGSWELQSNFILHSVIEVPCKRRYAKHNPKKRMVTRKYMLDDTDVCQATFTSTLGINHMRVDYCLRRKASEASDFRCSSPDGRGKNNSRRRNDEAVNSLREFLNKLPKFKSHSVPNKLYYCPTLTKAKLHVLYMNEMQRYSRKYISSYPAFYKIFRETNVNIYIPKKNICHFCEKMTLQLQDISSVNSKFFNFHQIRAQYAQERLKQSANSAKTCPNMLSFSFKLEHCLPLPHISSSISFSKRKLWCYNFRIYTHHDNSNYIYSWTENEGLCTYRELCSCIFEFLNSQNLSLINKISTFSDSCGSFNRNQNIVGFMMYISHMYNIDWEHTYLEFGHSSLPSDSDFSLIEKKMHTNDDIYSINHWMKLIESFKFKNNFRATRMNEKLFDFDLLNGEFDFRTINTNGDPFNWLQLRYLKVTGRNKVMHYKLTNDPIAPVFTIDFSRNNEKPLPNIFLKSAYPDGVKISRGKYDDLQSLLEFIPSDHHIFYRDIMHDDSLGNESSFHPDIRDYEEDFQFEVLGLNQSPVVMNMVDPQFDAH